MRYAIDEKPVSYTNYEGETYSTLGANRVDWREVIY
jgi:hypothetical protein